MNVASHTNWRTTAFKEPQQQQEKLSICLDVNAADGAGSKAKKGAILLPLEYRRAVAYRFHLVFLGSFRMYFRKKKRAIRHPDFPNMGATSYRQVLAAVEDRLNPEWYLEIGSRSGGSLSSIRTNYIAIDPEFAIQSTSVFNKSRAMLFFQQTSDDFFESCFLQKSQIRPKMAFIDGLHLFEFALRDFMNLERAMDKDGIICLHDVCPFNYEMTTRNVDYLKVGPAWTGDVWKTIKVLIEKRPDLDVKILDADRTGLAVVKNLNPTSTVLKECYDEVLAEYQNMELEKVGADAYYDLFPLQSSADFLTGQAG